MSGDQSSVISTTRPKEICWIDSQITSIKSLKLHSNLVTLNLHSNHISKIEGLQHLQNLRHLDLSSNQISHIEGLTSLGYLRVLNLSCNRIYLVEGLENLRKLTKLDLSYNFIENVSGLKDLHGNGYSLTTLYLHGNRIASLEHFISSVIGCISLKELTLQMYGEGNHVCNVSGYRDGVLSAMPGLAVLDGYDRTGRAAALNDDLDIPELEEYIQYLQSSSSCEIKTSDSSSSKETRFDVVTPRIDQVLNRFKQRGPLPSDSEQSSVNISPPSQEQARDRQIQGIQPPVDHEVRLGILENLLANFVTSQVRETISWK
ncbi:predicted protein [Nematostella vectensis]|uniref:Leucine-rich repeat and coiled-coil domain-containing protein 1 n=1 Tax=Nematostella vectensis TaxID=45351 RepID=A7SLU3_NEMVE|nr:predicted protein [Nematostella vectensis]|eukprot:XP_001627399.1 predicted protein [Nematostella vectensis]